jgi:mono/diheme cytochrome c family protein
VFASIPLAVIGFKRKKPVLAIVSVILLILSYGLAEMNGKRASKNKPKPEISQQANEAEVGKALYENYCQNCHGAEGDAGLSGAKNLKTTVLSAEEQTSIILNGKGVMPGFKTLNPNEVQSIVKHVQSLK